MHCFDYNFLKEFIIFQNNLNILIIMFNLRLFLKKSLFSNSNNKLLIKDKKSLIHYSNKMDQSNNSDYKLPPHHLVKTNAKINMPRFIYGTAWKKDRTTSLVVQAVNAGFRAIDTANQRRHYYEEDVGKALEQLYADSNLSIKREDIFLQTKFTSPSGQDIATIPYDKSAPLSVQVTQSLEGSLKNLKTKYIDSLVLHSPMKNHKDTMIVWETLETFYDKKVIRQIGISNIYDVSSLRLIWNDSRVKPSVVQNHFASDTNHDKIIRQFCNENNIVYQSFWSLTANPHILKHATVKEIASKYGKTTEQVFFCFLIKIGIAPLTGTTSVDHMQKDLEALNMELTSNEISLLNSLLD